MIARHYSVRRGLCLVLSSGCNSLLLFEESLSMVEAYICRSACASHEVFHVDVNVLYV